MMHTSLSPSFPYASSAFHRLATISAPQTRTTLFPFFFPTTQRHKGLPPRATTSVAVVHAQPRRAEGNVPTNRTCAKLFSSCHLRSAIAPPPSLLWSKKEAIAPPSETSPATPLAPAASLQQEAAPTTVLDGRAVVFVGIWVRGKLDSGPS
ncbi:hypothetical protein Droror1_Dr00020405 [Drosera rotundifolia]